MSFYRDSELAKAPQTQSAYSEMFDRFILAPGWNHGDTFVGKIGMAWREITRWTTGNVFASHPFLVAGRQDFQEALIGLVREEQINEIYLHKPHTLLLLRPALSRLTSAHIVIDLHDDFVARAAQYVAAYASLFANLSTRDIVHQHFSMWLRHHLCRTNITLSRQKELELLAKCDEILVASEFESQWLCLHSRAPKTCSPPAVAV